MKLAKNKEINSSHRMFVALAFNEKINQQDSFNEKINQQDLKGLSALMTEDHAFIDNSGEITEGKKEMTEG
jgi:ketosteroid isomerase-like protein